MKFSKPLYNTKEQIYVVDIQEGIRFESMREEGTFKPSIESFLESKRDDILTFVIESTKGWFSKPLTIDYLKSRLQFQLPTTDLNEFEGTVVWQTKKLLISKQSFLFEFEIIDMKPIERVLIDLPEVEQEDENIQEENLSVLLDDSDEVLSVGPTRRSIDKRVVMLARAKAARALYKAEKLTQLYCETYSYDTDWEDDSSDEEEQEDEGK
jgi:hypothetical protein